jgi:hypothetical protein
MVPVCCSACVCLQRLWEHQQSRMCARASVAGAWVRGASGYACSAWWAHQRLCTCACGCSCAGAWWQQVAVCCVWRLRMSACSACGRISSRACAHAAAVARVCFCAGACVCGVRTFSNCACVWRQQVSACCKWRVRMCMQRLVGAPAAAHVRMRVQLRGCVAAAGVCVLQVARAYVCMQRLVGASAALLVTVILCVQLRGCVAAAGVVCCTWRMQRLQRLRAHLRLCMCARVSVAWVRGGSRCLCDAWWR